MQTIVPLSLLQGMSGLQYVLDTNNGNNASASTVTGSATITIAGTAQAARLITGEPVATSDDAALAGAVVESYAVVGGNTEVTLSQEASATASGVAVSFRDQCIIKLAVATFSPGPNPTPADFTEASFDGYVAKHLAFNGKTPYLNGQQLAQVDAGLVSWELEADAVTPQTIVGYYVVFWVFGQRRFVWCYESLPNLPMAKAGDAIVLSVPLLFFGPGAATVIG